jgi:hypothetical protein
MYVLNRRAAEEDAKKYITMCGEMMREIICDFTAAEPILVLGDYDQMPGEEVFARFLYGFRLAPLKNSYLDDQRVSVGRNLMNSITYNFQVGYDYAAGGSSDPGEYGLAFAEIEAFLTLSSVFNKITAAVKGAYPSKPGRLIEDNILELISPRYAYAVALATARSQFTASVYFAKKIDTNSNGITPRVLYTLAGVSNGYIMQLIREDKLPAEKKDGLWHISTLHALAWLQSRNNCPDWVKKL